jgi:hypothetical protein
MSTFDLVLLGAGGLLLLGATICAIVAMRGEGKLVAIQNTPSTSAGDILAIHRANGAYGQAYEVAGVIECDASLSAPLSGQSCIAYSHTLAWEEWGKPPMYSRHSGAGELVYRSGGTEFDDRRVPAFWVRDASGQVLIDPTNAELDLQEIDQRYEVVTSSFGDSERRTRREERGLIMGRQVYVLGYLGERQGQPVLQRHPSDPSKKFLISYRSEQELARASRTQAAIYYFAAGISGSLGIVLILGRLLLQRGR